MRHLTVCVASIGLLALSAGSAAHSAQTRTQKPGRGSPPVQNADNPSDPKDAVQRVIGAKNSALYDTFGLGQSLVKIGQPVIDELTAALDTADPADRGYIAVALGLFGSKANVAIPKLISAFPLEPKDEIGIRLDKNPTSEEVAGLLAKLGKGSVVQQGMASKVPLNPDGTPNLSAVSLRVNYFFVIEAPAAVAALYKITGVCPGVLQQDWQEWLKTSGER